MKMNRGQKPAIEGFNQGSGVRNRRFLFFHITHHASRITVLLLFTNFFLSNLSYAGLRGLPEGKPRVEVGDNAPLEAEDLRKAHEEGKVILLMFGNPDHCIYCEKVWSNIKALLPKYGRDMAPILKTHRASKFWGPESEDVKLGEIYGVIGEPWLFVIDKKGIVRHIFMGFAGTREIEAELKKVLGQR